MSHTPSEGGGAVAITPTASPFVWRNTSQRMASVFVSVGTVSSIEWSRNGTDFTVVGVVAGQVLLDPGDYIRITYAVAPTVASALF